MTINLILKLHLLTILLSGAGFLLRGFWMMTDSEKLQARPVKIFPHINDTILLVSGITLVVLTGLYPWQQSWLMAKIIALLVYIFLGTIALKRGKTKNQKILAWLLAIIVFVYMIFVAKTHNPAPFGL
ncbi:MAG TPA: regulator SirB [Thiotrichales bacterium]|nr:regulator SirB [Thiotrichales bacterium]